MALVQNRHRNQWKRIESSEINPHTYGQSLTKEVRIYNGEKTVSLASAVGKAGQLHVNQ